MIVLSAGHYPAAPGACSPGTNYCEHTVALGWVHLILWHLRELEECAEVPTGQLGVKVAWINALRPLPTLAAEIHFNSDTSKAQRGCETIYCPGSPKGELIARCVQTAIGAVLPPSRGVKEGWYRMDKPGHVDFVGDVDGDEKVDYFLKSTNCPAVIIEPEFIYNRQAIETHREAACKAIAYALHSAANEIRTVAAKGVS